MSTKVLNRRKAIFGAIATLAAITFWRPSQISNCSYCREVTIYFPENYSFKNYQNDQLKWMNVVGWSGFLGWAEKKLIRKTEKIVNRDSVVYRFYFDSLSSLKRYERLGTEISGINLNKRNELGYTSKIRIFELANANTSQV